MRWSPIAPTPPHPEYPCAHCISAASVEGAAVALLGSGTVPEFSATTPTAPGVTHHWTRLADLTQETSNARILAGFHYRYSTEVAGDMGRRIGRDVVARVMQPLP